MKKENETKVVEIKHKIDSDFILDLYEKARKEKGEKKKQLMNEIHFLSEHIGMYLVNNQKK